MSVVLTDLDAKRAAGEVASTHMQVQDFQVTMHHVRHKAPAQGTMQEMVQLLLSPNLSKRRLEEKAQLALNLFFGWPAATRLVQAKIFETYKTRLNVNRKVVRAAACKKRMRKVKTDKEDAIRQHNVAHGRSS